MTQSLDGLGGKLNGEISPAGLATILAIVD